MKVEDVQDALQKVDLAAGKQAQETFQEMLSSMVQRGIMPKAALQISDDTMEAIYTQSYNLYNQGKYTEASYIFRLLLMLDPLTPKYALGIAACLHRMKDYQNAGNVYTLCAALDPMNPLPHFHAADCYLKLKAFELARFALNMTVTVAANQEQYSVVKARAEMMRDSIDEQIAAALAEETAETKEESSPS